MEEILRYIAFLLVFVAIFEINAGILIATFATSLPMHIRITVVPMHASIGLVLWYVGASIARMLS